MVRESVTVGWTNTSGGRGHSESSFVESVMLVQWYMHDLVPCTIGTVSQRRQAWSLLLFFRRKIGEGRRRVTSEDVGEERGGEDNERGSHSRPVYYR